MAKAKTTTSQKKTTTRAKTKTSSKSTSTADAEKNKGMAIVAYLLFFIPLLLGEHRKSRFVKFHTNQGTVLFLAYMAWLVVWLILSRIFVAMLFRGSFYAGYGLFGFGSLIMSLISIAFLVLLIIGIINAANGVMKPLPVIGRFEIIK